MNRNSFLKSLITATTVITMDGFSHLVNAIPHIDENKNTKEFASFGAMHLNNTDLKKATKFWTQIVGMKLRKSSDRIAEFGTETKTLVVIHEEAKIKYQKGYSGLYHFAIHAPNISEFASMIHRLNVNRYAYSPIDHTASKSIYLDDPDGINIEFTLETPERFKRVLTTGGLKIEGTDGVIRSASERLDLDAVMSNLADTNVNKIIHKDSYIGHVHLYANNVVSSNNFYKQMGFIQSNFLPQYMYADLGAGGDYTHRVVMNSWHGQNRPLAPKESAGMRHYQINFKNKEKMDEALCNLTHYENRDGGYWFTDPTGNTVLLKTLS